MSLNKAQLIKTVATATGQTQVHVEKTLKEILNAIKAELAAGGKVTLIGFGNYTVYERAARKGKNPQTGKTMDIPAKKVAKFKPGKELAEMVAAKKAKAAKKKK